MSQPAFRTRMPIDAYGDGGFRMGGVRFEGSVLLLTDGMQPWDVRAPSDVTFASLEPILGHREDLEFLIVGTGRQMHLLPQSVRTHFGGAGLGLEFMDTGAACRLYNVMIAEDRRVAAALIAVD